MIISTLQGKVIDNVDPVLSTITRCRICVCAYGYMCMNVYTESSHKKTSALAEWFTEPAKAFSTLTTNGAGSSENTKNDTLGSMRRAKLLINTRYPPGLAFRHVLNFGTGEIRKQQHTTSAGRAKWLHKHNSKALQLVCIMCHKLADTDTLAEP